MRKILFGVIIFVLLILLPTSFLRAADYPSPVGYVNDFAGLFSDAFRQELEEDLKNFEQETGAEIAVVTVETLGETYLEDYAVRLFEQWGIGKKDRDNGLLLLIAKNERQIRIEVGYGLEPVVTDAAAGRIIRDQISPSFKAGDYEKGVRQGTEVIKSSVRGGPQEVPTGGHQTTAKPFLPFAIFGVVFLSYLSAFWARSKRVWPGGVVGGLAGVFLGKVMGGPLPLWLGLGFGVFGFFLDLILSRNYRRLQKTGKPTDFWRSRGGFFSGGSGSSSGGGGGFGGFSGGSSGGGGASGGW